MRKAVPVVLLALLTCEAAAQEGHDIKNLRLGMDESEVRVILPNVRCTDTKKSALPERFCMDRDNTLAGHPARISVSLRSGAVVTVSARFQNASGPDVQRAALAKFGKPADIRKELLQTVMLWPAKDQMLILLLPDDGVTEGRLFLSSRSEYEAFNKAKQAKDKDM